MGRAIRKKRLGDQFQRVKSGSTSERSLVLNLHVDRLECFRELRVNKSTARVSPLSQS